jgi:hypothetical protein
MATNHKDTSSKGAKDRSAATAATEKCTPPPASEAVEKQAAEHFVRGVLTRGEAAHPVGGELPQRATHEIVEEEEGKPPTIKRRRFSTY